MIDGPVVAVGLHRLIGVMARYCEELARVMSPGVEPGDLRPWERAAIDMEAALSLAGECLSRGSRVGRR